MVVPFVAAALQIDVAHLGDLLALRRADPAEPLEVGPSLGHVADPHEADDDDRAAVESRRQERRLARRDRVAGQGRLAWRRGQQVAPGPDGVDARAIERVEVALDRERLAGRRVEPELDALRVRRGADHDSVGPDGHRSGSHAAVGALALARDLARRARRERGHRSSAVDGSLASRLEIRWRRLPQCGSCSDVQASIPRSVDSGDALAFIVVAVVMSTAISATIGVTTLCCGGVQPWARFWVLWADWWLGDALGALVVAPVILTTARPPETWSRRAWIETGLLVVGAVATTQAVFGEVIRS